MGECKRNKENRTSISQVYQASDAVAANALQSLEGKIHSGCSEGSSSASLWGRFGAVASQCPKSHRQCGFHKDLRKNWNWMNKGKLLTIYQCYYLFHYIGLLWASSINNNNKKDKAVRSLKARCNQMYVRVQRVSTIRNQRKGRGLQARGSGQSSVCGTAIVDNWVGSKYLEQWKLVFCLWITEKGSFPGRKDEIWGRAVQTFIKP